MAGKKYIDMKENDCTEYYLFPNLPPAFQNDKINLQGIEDTMENINRIVKKLSENYIWHNDDFQVSYKNLVSYVHSNSNEVEPFSFYGSLNYGENIEDEWFLVYLLLELTKKIDGLVVRVKDSDGEFLLIEAAEFLPSWVTPETCEDKVFLYDGEIRILPKSFAANEESYNLMEGLKYVREHPQETRADIFVQQAIRKRIAGYPEKIEENCHNAILYVPVGVAALLNAHPKLVAPAVRAFCERDLIDVKACRAMKYFPPENRIMTQVKFTKCLYAMLVSSKYVPDWKTGWNLPSPKEETYKSHLLGIKLACGFEILISQARSKHNKEESVDETDFTNDPNWKKFLKSLTANNYFRGLIEHSKDYNELLSKAKDYYKNSFEQLIKSSKAKLIAELMDKTEIDMDDLKARERNLPNPDDDKWMNISQKDLDAMLESRFGSDGQNAEMVNGYSDISHHLNTFINHVSGMEGAEFPKKNSKVTPPVRPKRGAKNKKKKTVKFSPDTKLHSVTSIDKLSTVGTNRVHFEPDGFINAIQNILDFSIPDDNYWESEGSGMSSYEDEADMELGETTKPTSKSKIDTEMIEYMDQLDEELSKTTLSESFVRKKPPASSETGTKKKDESFDDIEEFKPVDIDINALKNILSSYQAQMGEAGPAENLLGPMGINLDDIDADVD